MAAILNEIAMRKKLQTMAQAKSAQNFIYNAANTRLVFAKDELLEDFDNNEVIQEIKSSSNSPSDKESAVVSKGNLTAFLGLFPGEGNAQVQDLRDAIKNGINMPNAAQIELDKNKVTYSFKIKIPSKASLYSICKLNWTSKSWIEIIESGISATLRKFIFWSKGFKRGSRSGTGLQSKGRVQNIAELTPTKFISTLFDNFRNRFE